MRVGNADRVPDWVIGTIAFVVLAIGSWLAFTKSVPWSNPYEVKAVFESAQNVRVKSPVRIAGVDVGEVTGVEHLTDDSEAINAQTDPQADTGVSPAPAVAAVTMSIDEEALPLKEDATFKLRPRLFLEGNLFVEVKSGSPGSPEVGEDHVFGIAQTSNSVQLDQVLTGALQKDAREDLQILLDEFGTALSPDDPKGGAQGFRELYESSTPAFKSTSQVNEALLGNREGDLSGLIKNLDKTVSNLAQDEEALKDLVTNLRIFTGSLAAEEQNLRLAIRELPNTLAAARPALASLNAAFPSLRAFSREALPGVRASGPSIDAAVPLLAQIRKLSTKAELRGLVRDLRPAVPNLAQLANRTIPFLEEGRALASCFNNVIIPWSNDFVFSTDPSYPFDGQGAGDISAPFPVYKETAFGLAGIAGESRSGDANGQYIRVLGGGGLNTVQTTSSSGETLAGVTPFPLLGAMPALADSGEPQWKPKVACETQDAPNLGAAGGPPPDTARASSAPPGTLSAPSIKALKKMKQVNQLDEAGKTGQADKLEKKIYREYEKATK